MKHIIHICTLSLLLFNLAWGMYLIAVTYYISALLLAVAIVASLLAAGCIVLYVLYVLNPSQK